ncbi:hypothetical protein QRX60_32930 [Amycolatopsis mongoliensis]|uniref:Uncharacterized protein n=1 Tax=Amycolatopsis mongoliensis TaxID=715475 RepID=A0A9Y2NI58_9PSEU|nr:hypothetical protein [Amycolatopsis sp. 4-36]WIX98844.1 hypothetical protein QRX60_32930 [Amycolatopsis sp. 4-36]
MTESTAQRVKSIRIVNGLRHPLLAVVARYPAEFVVRPGGELEIRETAPPRGGYVELTLDAEERTGLRIETGESVKTEVFLDGEPQPLPSVILGGGPCEAAGPDLEAAFGSLQVFDTRSGPRTVRLEEKNGTTTLVGAGREPIRFAGVGVNGYPPELIIESDGLRIRGSHGSAR